MLTAIPSTEVALKVAAVPVPILDHLSTFTACLGLAIECKLLNLALNTFVFTHTAPEAVTLTFVHSYTLLINLVCKP